MKLNCVIVDDEPLAGEGLAGYVEEIDFLSLTGICENPLQLMKVIDTQPVDLIFLDIQMPKMTGIDFLKIAENPPMVILTTAYPDYAVEGFQLNVLDYLLKPIRFNRFYQAAKKALDQHMLKSAVSRANLVPAKPTNDSFFVKCGTRFEKIFMDDILFIEGMQNYVTIHTLKTKFMTILSLKSLEESLDAAHFIRTHKSFIVAKHKVQSIEGNEIFIGDTRVPIGRNYRDGVMEQLLGIGFWEKK